MADRPDQRAPSGGLSAEEADRLADQFRPSWEIEDDVQENAPPPVAAVERPSATHPQPGAPEPAAAAGRVHKGTLLGIAPPSDPPGPTRAEPARAPTADAPAAVPKNPAKQTLLGLAPIAPEPKRPEPQQPPAVEKEPPQFSGIAKPYVPKDGPSTPAVVIAPEASIDPRPKRVPAKTVPTQRYVADGAPHVKGDPASHGRVRSSTWIAGAALSVGVALLGAGLWMRARASSTAPPAPAVSEPRPEVPTPGATPAAVPTPEPAPSGHDAARSETPEPAPAAEPAEEKSQAVTFNSAHPPSSPMRAPRPARPVAKSQPAIKPTSPAEPGSTPQTAKAGGIVRDTPF
jgi:hypothetical protein